MKILKPIRKNVLLKKKPQYANQISVLVAHVDRVNLLAGDFLRFLKNFCDANGPKFTDIVGVNFFISYSYIKL